MGDLSEIYKFQANDKSVGAWHRFILGYTTFSPVMSSSKSSFILQLGLRKLHFMTNANIIQ
jgi:hypothetical protein